MTPAVSSRFRAPDGRPHWTDASCCSQTCRARRIREISVGEPPVNYGLTDTVTTPSIRACCIGGDPFPPVTVGGRTMPKTKTSLPPPRTGHRRKPGGGTTTRSRADSAADVGKTLRSGTSQARRDGLQRIGRDASTSLERYRVRPAGPSSGVPKKKPAPRQLKAKARAAARKRNDAPRLG